MTVTGKLKIDNAVIVTFIDAAPLGLDRVAVKLRVIEGTDDPYDVTLMLGESVAVDVTADLTRDVVAA